MGDILNQEVKEEIDEILKALSEDLEKIYKDDTYSYSYGQRIIDICAALNLGAKNIMSTFNSIDKSQRKKFSIYAFAIEYKPEKGIGYIKSILKTKFNKFSDESYGMQKLQKICKGIINKVYIQNENTDKKINTIMKRVKKHLEDALTNFSNTEKYYDEIKKAYEGLRLSALLDGKIQSEKKSKKKGLYLWYHNYVENKSKSAKDNYNSNEERAVMATVDKKYQSSILGFGTSRLKIIKSVVEKLKKKIDEKNKNVEG